eukprot:721862-Rhodomonas_salina.2
MRVDELAINLREKRVGYNEMTRGWDREEDFYQKKDVFKTAWYQQWVQHLTASMMPHGWDTSSTSRWGGEGPSRKTIGTVTWTTITFRLHSGISSTRIWSTPSWMGHMRSSGLILATRGREWPREEAGDDGMEVQQGGER